MEVPVTDVGESEASNIAPQATSVDDEQDREETFRALLAAAKEEGDPDYIWDVEHMYDTIHDYAEAPEEGWTAVVTKYHRKGKVGKFNAPVDPLPAAMAPIPEELSPLSPSSPLSTAPVEEIPRRACMKHRVGSDARKAAVKEAMNSISHRAINDFKRDYEKTPRGESHYD